MTSDYALILQTTYEELQIGLSKNKSLIAHVACDKKKASTLIVDEIDMLLKKAQLSLSDIAYLGVNSGPAPFTSLRVVVTTANGIAFASNIPLISLDGFAIFMHEISAKHTGTIIGLLNAFNRDVYLAFAEPNGSYHFDCLNIEQACTVLAEKFGSTPLFFAGNGAHMFEDTIKQFFGNQAQFLHNAPNHATLAALAQHAHALWLKQETTTQLLPRYLKKLKYKQSIPQ